LSPSLLACERLSQIDSESKTRQASIRHFLSAGERSTELSASLQHSLVLEDEFRKSVRAARRQWTTRGTQRRPTLELVSSTQTLLQENDTLDTLSQRLMSSALSEQLSARAEMWTQLSKLCASTSEALKVPAETSTPSSTP
jgi:hypothetical protein